jgi:hypothetical protein
VLWRRIQGGAPTGIIGQEGEAAPAGYEAWGAAPADPKYALEFSPETQSLQTKLRRTRCKAGDLAGGVEDGRGD